MSNASHFDTRYSMMLAIMDCLRAISSLLCDLVRFISLLLRPRGALAAENLFLRKTLAMYQERNLEPRRSDTAFRIGLVLLSRLENPAERTRRIYQRSRTATALELSPSLSRPPYSDCSRAAPSCTSKSCRFANN